MSNSAEHRERRRLRARDKRRRTRASWTRDLRSPLMRLQTLNRDEFAQTVERMTNKQRQWWMSAGQPGKNDRDISKLWAFVSPPRVSDAVIGRGLLPA